MPLVHRCSCAVNTELQLSMCVNIHVNIRVFSKVLCALHYQINADKGSLPSPLVQFFLTLFKRPLIPPPRFEHVCCNFLEWLLKKWVNESCDKIQQNDAWICAFWQHKIEQKCFKLRVKLSKFWGIYKFDICFHLAQRQQMRIGAHFPVEEFLIRRRLVNRRTEEGKWIKWTRKGMDRRAPFWKWVSFLDRKCQKH